MKYTVKIHLNSNRKTNSLPYPLAVVVESYFCSHALLPFIQPSEDSVIPEVGYCWRRMWLEIVVRDSGRVSRAPGENMQPQTGSALAGSGPRSRVLWSITSDLDVF